MKGNRTLYITIGVSKSGKTTWAVETASNNEDIVHISSDNIRDELTEGGEYDPSLNHKVFSIMYGRTKEYLLKGYDVIYDATNLSHKKRKALVENIIYFSINNDFLLDIQYKMFFCDFETLMDRAEADNFPKEVIQRQLGSYQVPSETDDVVKYRIAKPIFTGNANNLEQMIVSMSGFNQDNEYHKLDLLGHSNMVAKNIKIPHFRNFGIFHDVGKLYTKSKGDDGQSHYYGHANTSAYLYLAYQLTCMETSHDWINHLEIAGYIQEHMNIKFVKTRKALDKLIGRIPKVGRTPEQTTQILTYLSLMDDISRE